MTNIIKTAIITIIISFISGLLLEYYKNLAPKILCNIKNAMPIKINNKKISAYIITVSNVSNKTIHNLTLYIQSPHTDLRIADAKITKGLKFDPTIEDNTIDVHIPFLSKDDKFSVTVYAENQYEMLNKPVIIIRSPENFKQIDSLEQNGILSSMLNIPKSIHQTILNIIKKPKAAVPNKKDDFTMIMDKPSVAKEKINKGNRKISHKNKRPSSIKKVMITLVSIILLVFIGILGKSYFKGISTNASTPGVKTIVPNQSNDGSGSSGATKNAGSKASSKKTKVNADPKKSTGGTNVNTDSKTSTGGTNVNTNPKTSTVETNGNTDSKSSTDGTNTNTDSKTSTGGANNNADSKTSIDGTNANTDSKTSTSGPSANTDSKASTGGTNENTGSKTSTGGTTENTGN